MDKKGKGQVLCPNLWSFNLNSNHTDALVMDESERRWYCFEKWETLKQSLPDKEERNLMVNTIKFCPDFLSHFLHYMLNVGLSDFDPGEVPERTPTFYKMCRAGKKEIEGSLDDLMAGILEKRRFLNPETIRDFLIHKQDYKNVGKKSISTYLYNRE